MSIKKKLKILLSKMLVVTMLMTLMPNVTVFGTESSATSFTPAYADVTANGIFVSAAELADELSLSYTADEKNLSFEAFLIKSPMSFALTPKTATIPP